MTSVSDLPAAHDAFSHSLICSTLMTGIDMGKHYVICREKENSGDSSLGSMFDVRCGMFASFPEKKEPACVLVLAGRYVRTGLAAGGLKNFSFQAGDL